MPCFKPRHVWREPELNPVNGKYIIVWNPAQSSRLVPITLPCQQCSGCRLERSRQWAIRCMHEAKLHLQNTFITLTYDDEHLPDLSSLEHSHFQEFMKCLRERLRYAQKKQGLTKAQRKANGVRYYMCGEYGETFGRPHFHACLFNYDFPDKKPWKKIKGNQLYTSSLLQSLWPHGFSSIGSLTFESAAYVARYIMKKRTGASAAEHYEILDAYGEYHQRKPEYTKMSLKPGIAKNWLLKNLTDVYPSDSVILRGNEVKPPKYYDKIFEILYPSDMEEIKFNRLTSAKKYADNNTPERLAVRELVHSKKLEQLKRTIK